MTPLAPVAGTIAALTLFTTSTPGGVEVDRASSGSEVRALILLEEAAQSGEATPYEGVQFITSWSPRSASTFVVDVNHMPGYGTVLQVQGTPAEPGRAVFRRPDGYGRYGQPVAAEESSVSLLARHFDVVLLGTDTVAGRPTYVVAARRSDGADAARFWVDQATRLLLRREVYDRRGDLVRASAFVSVEVGTTRWIGHLPPMLPGPGGTPVSSSDLDRLRGSGWNSPYELNGRMELLEARRVQGQSGTVLQLSYSDGLSTLSVFQQRGRLDASQLDGYRVEHFGDTVAYVRDGMQRSYVWAADGIVYTVFTDAPETSVLDAIASFPHEKNQTGVLDRVARGFSRVGSWINPFG